jgi:hypothetical protein
VSRAALLILVLFVSTYEGAKVAKKYISLWQYLFCGTKILGEYSSSSFPLL